MSHDRIPLYRTAARVLPVDRMGRVLLLQAINPTSPDQPFWCTIGGGLEQDETPRQAAVRELVEETGIRVRAAELIGPLQAETIHFAWDEYDITQEQTFYAVAVGDVAVSLAGLDEIEQATTLGYRWWNAADLRASGQKTLDHVVPTVEIAVTAVRP